MHFALTPSRQASTAFLHPEDHFERLARMQLCRSRGERALLHNFIASLLHASRTFCGGAAFARSEPIEMSESRSSRSMSIELSFQTRLTFELYC
jgi:hypothetical protein